MVNTWRAPDVQSTSSRRNMLKCNDDLLGENIFRDRFGGGLPFRFSARTSRTRTSVEHVGWWVNIINRRIGGLPGFGSNHSLGIFEGLVYTTRTRAMTTFLFMYPERVQIAWFLFGAGRCIHISPSPFMAKVRPSGDMFEKFKIQSVPSNRRKLSTVPYRYLQSSCPIQQIYPILPCSTRILHQTTVEKCQSRRHQLNQGCANENKSLNSCWSHVVFIRVTLFMGKSTGDVMWTYWAHNGI